MERFVERFRAKATKARQAQSRMKMLAKMEDLAPLHVSAPLAFEFIEPLRAPNPLLVLEDIDAGYHGSLAEIGGTNTVILRGIRFSLQSGERYGLLGVNGAGKSTLIKTIAGELAPLAGSAVYGKGLSIGYFAQHQIEMLRDDQSPLWHLRRLSPDAREQALRNFLGGFNFPGEMALGPITHFSGGEKARLALALIVWQRPNLLLLDEPTNHLDLETREALTVALAQFEGTLVLVSHDRHLLRATTDQLLIVRDGGLQPFDGDLEDYRDWLLGRSTQKAASPERAQAPRAKEGASRLSERRAAAKQRQRQSDVRKPIESRLKRLEAQLAKVNARKSELDARLADPTLYEGGDREALKNLLLDQAYVGREIAQLEAEWLDYQTRLEDGV